MVLLPDVGRRVSSSAGKHLTHVCNNIIMEYAVTLPLANKIKSNKSTTTVEIINKSLRVQCIIMTR